MTRLIQPELLDTLPPDHPDAMRSRRDLRRVNAWMGNHRVMARVLRDRFPVAPKRIAEIGAGDGHFLLRVAEITGWRNVDAILVDLQKNISAETIDAFARLGWRAQPVVADVFDWNDPADVIVANLFLHHFDDQRLRTLLERIARHSEQLEQFVAVEPHRFAFPPICGQLLRFIGCNAVTRHDATVSVGAGFIRQEISSLWPDKERWKWIERRAGIFSHLFVAQKKR